MHPEITVGLMEHCLAATLLTNGWYGNSSSRHVRVQDGISLCLALSIFHCVFLVVTLTFHTHSHLRVTSLLSLSL